MQIVLRGDDMEAVTVDSYDSLSSEKAFSCQ